MVDLLTDKRWAGEFFPPDTYESRFFGEITYSNEEGVILCYTITGNAVPESTEVLHGVLNSGKKCTLIGRFSPRSGAGMSFQDGLTTRSGKAGFQFLTIGEFLAHDHRFNHVEFSLTNLQEFFYPSGSQDSIKFSKTPIYSVAAHFGKIEVINDASFIPIDSNIASHVHCDDSQALIDLNLAFQEVQSKYPASPLYLKKNFAYKIVLTFEDQVTILEAYQQITTISNLLALLTFNPVCPERIQLSKLMPAEFPITLAVYPSMALNPRTAKLSTLGHFHWQMPITHSNVALDSIVSKWLAVHQNHWSIISGIQHETEFRTARETHGEIVLYAAQFESISHNAGRIKQKYQYPLDFYATQKLRDGLMKIFGMSTLDEVAVAVGDLRNEIAHVGRPQKLLATLTLSQLVKISQYLRLTIIGYTMSEIGVPRNVIDCYQDKFSPTI